jgi:hypothetical protein
MDSSDLTREQAQRMQDALSPALAYLNKLMGRMQRRSFDHDDDLWKRARRARIAVLDLITELRSVGRK